jgi:hypothetical protein
VSDENRVDIAMGKRLGPLGRLLVDALTIEEMRKQLPKVAGPVPTRLAQLLDSLARAEANDTALKWDAFTLSAPRDPDWLN